MKLVAGHDATVIDWLGRAHGVYVHQTPMVALGTVDNLGVLRGAFVITWRTDTTAELSVYGAVSPDVFKGMFRAVFLDYGVHRFEVRTSRKNKKVRKAALKFGWRFECVARDYYGPCDDAFCYAMTADHCRWIKGTHRGLTLQLS
jgi:hypothetical protein